MAQEVRRHRLVSSFLLVALVYQTIQENDAECFHGRQQAPALTHQVRLLLHHESILHDAVLTLRDDAILCPACHSFSHVVHQSLERILHVFGREAAASDPQKEVAHSVTETSQVFPDIEGDVRELGVNDTTLFLCGAKMLADLTSRDMQHSHIDMVPCKLDGLLDNGQLLFELHSSKPPESHGAHRCIPYVLVRDL